MTADLSPSDPPPAESLTLSAPGGTVSALLTVPPRALALLVLAHGAGAAMDHRLMAGAAVTLARHRIGTLRYNFPYMEAGSRRPDRTSVLEATVRSAVGVARELRPRLPLLAGGRSMGGRMTSRAQSAQPMPIEGLVFLAFPLHPAGRPGRERAEHLAGVALPMLFVSGTRDNLARLDLLQEVSRDLGDRVTLHLVEDGDHSFKVRKRSGRSAAEVDEEIGAAVEQWTRRLLGAGEASGSAGACR